MAQISQDAWSYRGDLSMDLDWIRFTIGDTDPDDAFMTDAEIESLLDLKGSKEQAALSCMEYILVLLIKDSGNYKIGSTSVNTSDRYNGYKALYDEFSAKLSAGDMLPQVINTKPIFSVGMMDERW